MTHSSPPSFTVLPTSGEPVGIGGLACSRILASRLFAAGGPPALRSFNTEVIAAACRERWTDFADTLTALPGGIELMLVIAPRPAAPDTLARPAVTLLVVGRGEHHLRERVLQSLADVGALAGATLDFLEFEPITRDDRLEDVVRVLGSEHVLEFERRYARVTAGEVLDGHAVPGFISFDDDAAARPSDAQPPSLWHLFAWTPTNDPWRRLLDVLANVPGDTAMIVRVRALPRMPDECRAEAYEALAAAERWSRGLTDIPDTIVLAGRVALLRAAALRRADLVEGRALCARVFLAGNDPPTQAEIATVVTSIDDAAGPPDSPEHEVALRGGVVDRRVESIQLLEPMDRPSLRHVFSAREVCAVLRSPLPATTDYPCLDLLRSRTARLTGATGDDAHVGVNRHAGTIVPARLEATARTRHTYIVGQTGTGKSTLLLNMVLHDIRSGHGVGVIDPHGTLTEEILARIPARREDDVLVVDAVDYDWPVGLNALAIAEQDPRAYVRERDLVIEDYLSYFRRTYNLDMQGPMFEDNVRGMLGILLGSTPQRRPLIPNVLLLKELFSNSSMRSHLVERARASDPTVEAFNREAVGGTFTNSLANTSSYVTSKFNRFVSDTALRNMLCQSRMVDIDAIVNERGILLVNLARGRFGELAASLLASLIVSGIRRSVFKRAPGTGAPLFALYVDEFQLVADDRFVELLAEARKFNLALTLAHQFVDQLPAAVRHGVFGNAGTSIVFRTGPTDAELLEPLVRPEFSADDIISLPNFRAYVRSAGSRGRTSFSIDTLPPPDAGKPERAARIRDLSRAGFARPVKEVEEEINWTYAAYRKLGGGD